MKIGSQSSEPEKNSHQKIKHHEDYRRSPTKPLDEARLAHLTGEKEMRMVLPKPRQLLNGGRSERHSSKQ